MEAQFACCFGRNGPIIQSGTSSYHMYLPLYPKGLLYNPTALLFGTAPTISGPWSWENLTGGDLPAVVDVNPGALVFDSQGKTVYSLWTAGAVYVADAPGGPFKLVPDSNSSGCSTPILSPCASGRASDSSVGGVRGDGPSRLQLSFRRLGQSELVRCFGEASKRGRSAPPSLARYGAVSQSARPVW